MRPRTQLEIRFVALMFVSWLRHHNRVVAVNDTGIWRWYVIRLPEDMLLNNLWGKDFHEHQKEKKSIIKIQEKKKKKK